MAVATAEKPETEPRRAPCQGKTLVEALRYRAEERGDSQHLIILENDREVETLTFSQLSEGAQAMARALKARGIKPGQTVALMLPTGRDFYFSFLGVLVAGAVPVPIYPPVRADQLEEYVARHAGVLQSAGVRGLILFREAEVMSRLLGPRIKSLKTVARADQLLEEGRRIEDDGIIAEVGPEDLGLIQYTSGSTGDPKGVTLTHTNLLSNAGAIGESLLVHENDVVVSWLPLYHDMGLIGCWLFALSHGLKMISMSPLQFLRRPRRWFQAFSHYRGTLSPAPNFAYELCLRRIPDRDLEGIDLSSWRVALNGAEPISPEILDRFAERFGPIGFRPQTMMPVYGLAENSVAVTFSGLHDVPRIDRLDREPFERQRKARPAKKDQDEADTLSFVSVGRAIPGQEARVVGDDGLRVDEREEGQIEFRGTSTTPGYFKNPTATAEIRTPDGWTRSGDLGYLADGDLFITGRSKDLIIKGGRNIYPQEVEAIAAEVKGVRRGCVAAFSIGQGAGKEKLVIVAETRAKKPEELAHLALEVKRAVSTQLKVSPDEVVMAPPNTVPKTPSGKIRRSDTRARFEDGKLLTSRAPAWLQFGRLQAFAFGHTLRNIFSKP